MILHAVMAFALVIGVVSVYAQTAGFSFVRLDDQDYTFLCPFVKDGFSVANIIEAFRRIDYAAIWMPITSFTYMTGISLFGPGPCQHHLLNVAFHAVNAILLYVLLFRLARCLDPESRIVRATAIACVAAAFWALHPMRVESVAWIASRKDVVFLFFTLCGLLCWDSRRWWLGGVCCALACMAKPSAMVFPVLAICLEMISRPAEVVSRGRRSIIIYAPLFLMAVATGLLAMYSQTHADGDTLPLMRQPFAWRLLNGTTSLGMSLKSSLWPTSLAPMYRAVPDGVPLHMVTGIVSLIIVSVVFVVVWIKTKDITTKRVLSACAAWYLIAIGPTLGVAGSFGNHARADRFTYLPSIAISILIVLLLVWVVRALGIRAFKTAVVATVILIMTSAVMSFSYAQCFRDNLALFERAIACDPDYPEVLTMLGNEYYMSRRDPERGIALLRRSYELCDSDKTAAQLAFALAMRGRPEDFNEVKRVCGNMAQDFSKDPSCLGVQALGLVALRREDWFEAARCFKYLEKHAPQEDVRMKSRKTLEMMRARMPFMNF